MIDSDTERMSIETKTSRDGGGVCRADGVGLDKQIDQKSDIEYFLENYPDVEVRTYKADDYGFLAKIEYYYKNKMFFSRIMGYEYPREIDIERDCKLLTRLQEFDVRYKEIKKELNEQS